MNVVNTDYPVRRTTDLAAVAFDKLGHNQEPKARICNVLDRPAENGALEQQR